MLTSENGSVLPAPSLMAKSAGLGGMTVSTLKPSGTVNRSGPGGLPPPATAFHGGVLPTGPITLTASQPLSSNSTFRQPSAAFLDAFHWPSLTRASLDIPLGT